MKTTKVKELMTRDPKVVNPEATLKQAAEMMRDIDCGVLPVGSESKLEGMITDRDIVIRAIAEGKDPATEKVKSCMTDAAHACSENATLSEAAEKMNDYNVSRLIVQDDAGRMTGILTFGAILRKNRDEEETSNVVQYAVGKAA